MNTLKKRMKNEKGMTLVELLAVLVILGIIAAIAVPMVTTNIQESRNKANVNEALNIISAAKLASIEQNNKTEFTITKDDNGLEGYIDINVDEDQTITVKLDEQWTISGHPAVKVIDENNTEESSVTEAELRAYLKDE